MTDNIILVLMLVGFFGFIGGIFIDTELSLKIAVLMYPIGFGAAIWHMVRRYKGAR